MKVQIWISYSVFKNTPTVRFHKFYELGHSMKCKWTAFIHDLENHGTSGKWWVSEDTPTRKVVNYDDQISLSTVFQLITMDVVVPEGEFAVHGSDGPEEDQPADNIFFSLMECVESGKHLTDCDKDGYCNYCGEQELPDRDIPEVAVDDLIGGNS